jgi:hypothetical protein
MKGHLFCKFYFWKVLNYSIKGKFPIMEIIE